MGGTGVFFLIFRKRRCLFKKNVFFKLNLELMENFFTHAKLNLTFLNQKIFFYGLSMFAYIYVDPKSFSKHELMAIVNYSLIFIVNMQDAFFYLEGFYCNTCTLKKRLEKASFLKTDLKKRLKNSYERRLKKAS